MRVEISPSPSCEPPLSTGGSRLGPALLGFHSPVKKRGASEGGGHSKSPHTKVNEVKEEFEIEATMKTTAKSPLMVSTAVSPIRFESPVEASNKEKNGLGLVSPETAPSSGLTISPLSPSVTSNLTEDESTSLLTSACPRYVPLQPEEVVTIKPELTTRNEEHQEVKNQTEDFAPILHEEEKPAQVDLESILFERAARFQSRLERRRSSIEDLPEGNFSDLTSTLPTPLLTSPKISTISDLDGS